MELPPSPPVMPPAPAPKKRPLWQYIVGGVVGLLVLCCAGSVVLSAIGRSAPESQAAAPTRAAQPVIGQVVTALPAEVVTDEPAATPAPTKVAAPTDTPAPEPTATQPPQPTTPPTVGSRVEAGNQALTVVNVSRAAKLGQFFKADAGKVFIIAEVLIEATGDKVPYNPLYFKVKDADGREYTPSIGADDSLKSGELTSGDKARGNVAFEIPKDAKGLVLNYKPLILFDATDAIRIALPDQ